MLIHTETEYFAGAQKMLEYFLKEMQKRDCELILALCASRKMQLEIPSGTQKILLPENQPFTIAKLIQQIRIVRQSHRDKPIDVFHGWTARDWLLTAVSGVICRRVSFGNLHDHPAANFFSTKRKFLLKQTANFGLRRIICVSDAVKTACLRRGYKNFKLTTVHNGLPELNTDSFKPNKDVFQIGYLGAFSVRKGLRELFLLLDELAGTSNAKWEVQIAGEAQDAPARELIAELRDLYQNRSWWERVRWVGWVKDPTRFLQEIDLLIVPSRDFDPFPTVLLEAGQLGVPVIAANVGGVSEIVDVDTGWLFEPGDWGGAAEILGKLINSPEIIQQYGATFKMRVKERFSAKKMADAYIKLYTMKNGGRTVA